MLFLAISLVQTLTQFNEDKHHIYFANIDFIMHKLDWNINHHLHSNVQIIKADKELRLLHLNEILTKTQKKKQNSKLFWSVLLTAFNQFWLILWGIFLQTQGLSMFFSFQP